MIRRLPVTPTPPEWRDNHSRWQQACAGELPAEALPTRDREDLIYDLWTLDWTDTQIAEHTKSSRYTVARIRRRLGLNANQEGAA